MQNDTATKQRSELADYLSKGKEYYKNLHLNFLNHETDDGRFAAPCFDSADIPTVLWPVSPTGW